MKGALLLALPVVLSVTGSAIAPGTVASLGPAAAAASSLKAAKGINGSELHKLDPVALEQRLREFKELGVEWVRFGFEWSSLQPVSAQEFSWAAHDRVVAACNRLGLRILGILAYTPSWANGGKESKYHPPRDAKEFARFVGEVARRYGADQVPAWEIWNEPNLAQFWRPAADPGEYVKLLKAASRSIRAASPRAIIVSGGLAQPRHGGGDWDAREFLAAIYSRGAGKYIDAVGNHPYTTPHLPTGIRGANWRKMAWSQPSMLGIMHSYGDGHKKIWITEFGAPTAGRSEHRIVVDEERQARMVKDLYSVAREQQWAGPVFWYNYLDFCPYSEKDSPRGSTECYYGLRRHDGVPKPGYFAYREIR